MQQQQNLIAAIAERKCFSDTGSAGAADSDLSSGRNSLSAVLAFSASQTEEEFIEIRHSVIPVLYEIFPKPDVTNMKFQQMQIAFVQHPTKCSPT